MTLHYQKAILSALFVIVINTSFAAAPCTPVLLKCEYSINPIGIDMASPRFSWQLRDDRRSAIQTAYQVLIATDSVLLLQGTADSWQPLYWLFTIRVRENIVLILNNNSC